jgi:hypothetical protein
MTTFVTALIDIHEELTTDKSIDIYLSNFKKLVDTGIHIHLFISQAYADLVATEPNVHKTVIELEDLDTFRELQGVERNLPEFRYVPKDTERFMILMNSKSEFLRRSIKENVYSTQQFAWIDFGIFHIFKNAVPLLHRVSQQIFRKGVHIPGCWERQRPSFSKICWRFCGGFFVGDVDSVLEFDNIYRGRFRSLISETGVLAWEVNVWAQFEDEGWNPVWYRADHNDSILDVPQVLHVPSDAVVVNHSPFSELHLGGPIYKYILECARPHALTSIFVKSDGVIEDEEFDKMIASLGREDTVTMPSREYKKIEALAMPGTKPLVCIHSARSFTSPSMLLLPCDDGMFEHGIAFPLIGWDSKVPTVFWRGGSSGFYRPSIRMQVVDCLYGVPNTDVRFVRRGWPINDSVIPDHHFSEYAAPIDHIRYKYIMVIDGNTMSSNGQWVFATGSVPIIVTHPESQWWLKGELKPMVNYVPICYDLSDLKEKIEWLVTHDDEARQIAENALVLSRTVLTPDFQRSYLKTCIDKIVREYMI